MRDNIFLVFNTACFGDVLLCNSLCQNIKHIYPSSKVVFIVDKPFYEVAKYQKDVDEVVVFDKRGEHSGLKGILKFVKEFPYKKANYSFLTYGNFRNYLVSMLLGVKKVVNLNKQKEQVSVQERAVNMLSQITDKQLVNYPIRFNPPIIEKTFVEGDYIALCPLSKRKEKDLPIETAIDLIKKSDKKFVLLGKGESAVEYSNSLKQAGCVFVDLVNKTTTVELASVLKNAQALVSIDTGTLHLACALDVPTVVVFYEKQMLPLWAPDEKLYRVRVLKENQNAEEIIKRLGDFSE